MKTVIIILATAVIISGALIFMGQRGSSSPEENKNNVTILDGKQIIDMSARGGYWPRKTTAKANMPTTIKMTTEGTFDCSSSLRIPSVGYAAHLPSSGITEIAVPPQKPGSVVRGLCSMGMYGFEIDFN